MANIKKLIEKAKRIEKNYESHFGDRLFDRRIGWWDPLNIYEYPDELENGVAQMERDVQHAIETNTPIEKIENDNWDKIVF